MDTETVRGCLEYENMFCARDGYGRYNYHCSVKVNKAFRGWNRGSRIVRSYDTSPNTSESNFFFDYVDNHLNWVKLGSVMVRYGENMIVEDVILADHANKTILRGKELWEELEHGEILFAMFEALDRDCMW